MNNDELLLAMSDMLDMKLQPIKDDIHGQKEDVSGLKEDVSELKGDVSVLKKDVGVLKEDVSELKEDVSVLKKDVGVLKGDVYTLQGEMKEVKGELRLVQDNICNIHVKMDRMETEIHLVGQRTEQVGAELHQVKLVQENVVVPRLNNIEEVYLSTYARYKKGAERMEGAFDDIDLLKKTVMNHSAKLQKLA